MNLLSGFAESRLRASLSRAGEPLDVLRRVAKFPHKLFYLRTRVRRQSQAAMAAALGLRQASISHFEQGLSAPSSTLLLELAKYFDVTPTYLLDDERGLVPAPTDRWSLRTALLTTGMWVEAPERALVTLPGGKVLCPLLAGEAFFDAEAAAARARSGERGKGAQPPTRRRPRASALEREIASELAAQRKRRRT